MIGYWFLKSFVVIFQIWQLWQQEWKYVQNKFQFLSNFPDVLVSLVTILFRILFEFLNYKIFEVQKR